MHTNGKFKVLIALITLSAICLVCLLCGCDDTTSTSHTHELEFVDGVPPTCIDEGILAHWHCSLCDKDFKEEEAQTVMESVSISTSSHRFKFGYVWDEEFHYKECSVCDYISISDGLKHFYSYKADENEHWEVCYCGYETAREEHDIDDDNGCSICHYGELMYELSDKGPYYICKGASSAYKEFLIELDVPATYRGLPVKEIGARAFTDCTALKEVTLSRNIVSIDDHAFLNCTALEKVALNEGLMEVLSNAFSSCTAIEEIVLPSTLTKLGNEAFNGCSSLKKINIPAKLKTIESRVFKECSSLEELIIPSSVTKIDYAAFSGTGLKELVLPDGLTQVSMTICLNCTNLEKVVIPASVTQIGVAAFSGCTSLQTIVFLGTEEQWNEISLAVFGDGSPNPQDWDYNTGAYTIIFGQ